MGFDRFSKENRWYYQDIDGHIKPQSRKLLEKYSHIPPEDVDSYIYKMVPLSSTPIGSSLDPPCLMLNTLGKQPIENQLTPFSATLSGLTPPTLAWDSSNS
jgi:hypothetical protein